jgi:EmrB/QacA subfamily drug resistance transporter
MTVAEETKLDPRRWKALALLGTAFFMVILDATIVLTAVPSMQEDLGLTVSGVQWVVTAYALAFGGLLLFCGRMADLLGRRRVFMTGVVLFAASSLVCGLAWSGEVLIAARAVQGISAAIMAPTALSLVMTTFPDGPERNKALGVWGGLGGVGATAGLLIGGLITSGAGWEWVFFINLPVGIVLLALSPVLLSESRDTETPRVFDPAGAITVTAALALLVYTIFKAPEVGWTSGRTILMLAGSVLLFAVFLLVESRTTAPLVPLRIFGKRTLTSGNVLVFTAGMAVDGLLFTATIFAQQVLGYSALRYGLLSAAMTVTSVVGVFAGQALVTKVGLRPIGIAGMLLIGAGSLSLAWVSGGGDLLIGMLVFGPGMGAAFVGAQIAALDGIAEHESGLASGLFDTSFNIGTALGIAIVTTVAISHPSGHRAAFAVTAGFVLLGLLAAVLLPGRTPDPTAVADPTPATPAL